MENPPLYLIVPEDNPSGYSNSTGCFRLLAGIIPAANPDFEKEYPKVRQWLLEVDGRKRNPLREIGLDEHGTTIVAGPLDGNYGVWTDGNVSEWKDYDWSPYERILQARFEREWESFVNLRASAGKRPKTGNRSTPR